MANEPLSISGVHRCGATRLNGARCLRRTAPGERCVHHRGDAVDDGPEGLAQLPHLTERELRVLLVCVERQKRLPISRESGTGRILWSLHTAIAEAISAAELDRRRREEDA
jgi:hypothetical protein